jgi:hypothetical protein
MKGRYLPHDTIPASTSRFGARTLDQHDMRDILLLDDEPEVRLPLG